MMRIRTQPTPDEILDEHIANAYSAWRTERGRAHWAWFGCVGWFLAGFGFPPAWFVSLFFFLRAAWCSQGASSARARYLAATMVKRFGPNL